MELSSKELLDIKSIVQFGIRAQEDYKISFYKEIYGTDVSVRIRGLSSYEYELIGMDMFSELKDAATINYIFKPENEKAIKELGEKTENEKDKSIVDKELPPNISITEILKSYMLRNVFIVFYAMKDFYKDLTVDDVKKMEGLDEIAKRVNEKSGRTKEIMEKIEFFRGKLRKH